MPHKKYNFIEEDVIAVYAGPGGKLWELLMGEQIHVGGKEHTDILASKIGLNKASENTRLLDICSALGGPARHLAEKYGIRVMGLDITSEMINEARKRTEGKPYAERIEYRLGSGLNVPADNNSFDIVWGQDAWCYIKDKEKLLEEVSRVVKPGGTIAYTDWIWGSIDADEATADFLMEFMVFPNMETLEGYHKLIENAGLVLEEKHDLGDEFASYMDQYVTILLEKKDLIVENFGEELYKGAESGVLAWQKAAHQKWVSRGLWIARKP